MTATAARITKITKFLADTTGRDYIDIATVREALAHPADFDTAAVALYTQGTVNLVPRDAQWLLTQADRDAAVEVGGEAKHWISLG